jgi:hypothetical protein
MHVFICWSGRRSRRLAQAVATGWLPAMFGDHATSFVSFANIEAGEGWYDRVLAELGNADAAILCLTPENLRSPWLHFESGMASRLGKGVVFTFFLGADAGQIQDPLKQIQVTLTTESDAHKLALKLAGLANVTQPDVESRWAGAWDDLSMVIREVGTPGIEDLFPGFDKLFEGKTFSEPLRECTDQEWLKRYDGARDTAIALESHRELVVSAGEPWQIWLYDKLMHQVTAYVDELKKYLLREQPFQFGDNRLIDFGKPEKLVQRPTPPTRSAMCERRCREIRHGLFCLTRPDVGAPVLPESLAFAKLGRDQFDDKKQMIHARGLAIDRNSLGLHTDADLERCARSVWVYDRIMYYKARDTEPATVAVMVRLAEQELEKAQSEDEPSLMALHYAVKTLAATMGRNAGEPFETDKARRLVTELQEFLDRAGRDNDPKIRRSLSEIRARLGSIQPTG